MANNKSIQFLRGDSSKRAASNESLLPGQPFYETDTNRLYVGEASGTALKTAKAINRPVEVYRSYITTANYRAPIATPEKNHSLVFFIQFYPISTSDGGKLELLPCDSNGNISPLYSLSTRNLIDNKEGLKVVVLTTNSDGELIIYRDNMMTNVGKDYTKLYLNITKSGSEAGIVGFSLD